jgi:hypothetical protein
MTDDVTRGRPVEAVGGRHETVILDFTVDPTPLGDLFSRAKLAGLEFKWFDPSSRAHLFNPLTTAQMLRLVTPGCDRPEGDPNDR